MGRFSGFKNLQILALGKKNLASRGPTALGRTRFFARGLMFEDFSTLGMKKFPYLKTGPFGNPIFNKKKLNVHNMVNIGQYLVNLTSLRSIFVQKTTNSQ